MKSHNAPPIQWLVVFEAVVKELSFKKAADRLHVSPPAISQQIKSLEQWLGVPLFERHARRISLTPAGTFYSEVAINLVRAHKQGHLEFLRRYKTRSLHVSAPLFIAQEFMIPNYRSFKDFLPDTELRIETRSSYVDFDAEPLDAAIRYGDGQWPTLNCQLLCATYITPVCSPEYLAKNPLDDIRELSSHQLISPTMDLDHWGVLLGKPADQHADILVCDSYLGAIKAASEGLGVTLALLPSTNEWINDGRLVLPLSVKVQTPQGYWGVAPKHSGRPAEVEAFYRWAGSLFDNLAGVDKSLVSISLPF